MNFLDPTEWNDLENLAKEHEVLDETKIKELHNRLRPYFLRRIKSEVLQLPPKVRITSLNKFESRSFPANTERSHYTCQHDSTTEGGVQIYP